MEVEVIVRITVKDEFVKDDPSLVTGVLNEMDYEFTHEAIEDTEIVDYNWEF
jgi:predicted hydrolase (HD superfamily)